MATKTYILEDDALLTSHQLQMVREASLLEPVYDDENPELTDEQLSGFKRVHEANQMERRKQNITLRITPQTIRKAKSLGKGYSGILSRIIENVLNDPEVLRKYL